ncbi:hypothetical protein DLAC_02730 [Tieghemostelium lacteum]|uniref:BSD domain-containing protein n=1 Tax=Tieghemostelium lacteum TaxID=361077 RepID=A0A152A349_TIELA|nr:hypothetical protein DLAC_02730 [Tieghemostelium lacteum]|eukprot:KYR00692.1 hypothetical protein DLAC_02730 [Tieghemostelium lacteum]
MEFHYESLIQRNPQEDSNITSEKNETDSTSSEEDLVTELDKLTTNVWGSITSLVSTVKEKSSHLIQEDKPKDSSEPKEDDNEEIENKTTNEQDSISNNVWGFWSAIKEKSTGLINIYKDDIQEFRSNLQVDTDSDKSIDGTSTNTIPLSTDPLIDVMTSSSTSNNNEDTEIDREQIVSSINNLTNSIIHNNLTSPIFNKISHGITNLLSEYPPPPSSTPLTAGTTSTNKNNNIEMEESLSDEEKESFKLFLNDPIGQTYISYKNNFKIADNQKEIIDILTRQNQQHSIKESYNLLVPSKVNEFDFWCRYFFKELQIKENKLKLQGLISKDEEEVLWDNNDKEEEKDVEEEQNSNNNTIQDNNNNAIEEKLNVIESYEKVPTPTSITNTTKPIVNNNNNSHVNSNIRTTPKLINSKVPSVGGELNEWEVIDKRSTTSTEEEDWSSWE